ncbi:hypothetical protein HYH03_012853 [Edaphochlamys debaryana]|uniref:V-SNARE coiled-coil homology domain-containing protein n=1 Tax=Edaphochlamys debaryana TaxID=47281 RepID=A0A836BV00_9CHLO|nr:hypothetical protein HYH03_012853 [Edaphochlamys debaryana]|eukprot:KAG2488533.1 hypothetical protein HYH03_012853 [Edaphochlamys debaryana]
MLPSALLDRMAAECAPQLTATGAADSERTAKEISLAPHICAKKLKALMDHAAQHPEELSRVVAVQKKVDEAKAVMVDNISRVLDRGEKLSVIVERTEELDEQASRFQRTSNVLRRRLCCANVKLYIIVGMALTLLAVVIFLLVCFSGGNCLK